MLKHLRLRLIFSITFTLALINCWCVSSIAQVPGYIVQNIGSHQGLPSSEIFEIFQDSKGFIWIGTNAGFSRYDGYSFENFQYLNQERIGLVYSIKETSDHSIWFCSEMGLFLFRNSILTKTSWQNLSAFVPFFDIEEDVNGNLFIGSSRGLAKIPFAERPEIYEGKTLSIENYLVKSWQEATENKEKAIIKLSVNAKGEMLIGTMGSVYYFNQQELERIWEKVENSDYVTSVSIDSSGYCTWGTAQIGINTWKNGKTKSYNETSNIGLYGTYDLVASGDFLTVLSASRLFSYLPSHDQIKSIVSIRDLDIKWITCMLVDKEGNYWVGSHEGMYYLKKNPFTLLEGNKFIRAQEVYSVYQTRNGTMLAGSNRGYVYHITSDTAIPYLNGRTVVSRAEVFKIYEDKRGWLWFATGYQGISVYRNDAIENFKVTEGLADNTNSSFFLDSKNQLWSIGDNGITKINIESGSGKISLQKFVTALSNSLDFKLYNAIEGPDGSFWIAGSPGILHFDGKTIRPYPLQNASPGELNLQHILKDDKGNIWIASSDYGIFQCYFDSKNSLQIKKNFSIKDGLSTNTFLSIALDNAGNLWAGSYSGVSCVQLIPGDSYRIRNFNSNDGFIEYNFNAPLLFSDRDGIIWTSGTKGISFFDPSELLAIKKTTAVFVTRIELLNADSTISVYASGQEINATPLSLNATNNSLTIHFTALQYSNPGSLRYYYRFNQTDSNWVEVNGGRSISFRQLSPGDYTLQLKASIGGNEFSPVTNFKFRIAPPFWQRWWFILPVVFFLGFIYLRLLKIREKNIKEKEAQKTELQKLKTISYQYQLEIEQVTNYFATSMSEQKSVDDMLWDVTRNCISKLGFEDCVIYLKDEQRHVLIQKAAWGPKTTEENKISNPIEIPVGKGIVGTVALSGKAEIINDTSKDDRYIVDDIRRFSEITVPITENGKVRGVIDSEHSQKDFYTGRHLQILTTIASLIADKIDKMNAEQEVREREIQLITLNRDLATSQLTALRAQMNPHFIFNALNSIQQYILTGNVDQANKYLSKFSKLQREVLNHCDQNFINLEKEIEMLNLYLELEQLRFNENFEYSFSIEKEIDITEVKIPPMILQPFVENAIWHGLMPKKTYKKVSLEFALHSEDLLQCIIRDNGIGRAASARQKEEGAYKNTNHKSKGLTLVYERMNILRQQYDQPFEVSITDLTDKDGEILGTRVSLLLYIGMLG